MRTRTRTWGLQSRAGAPGPPPGLVPGSGQDGGAPSLCHLLCLVVTAPPHGSWFGPKGTWGHTEVADAGQEQGDWEDGCRLGAGAAGEAKGSRGTEQTPRTRAKHSAAAAPQMLPRVLQTPPLSQAEP